MPRLIGFTTLFWIGAYSSGVGAAHALSGAVVREKNVAAAQFVRVLHSVRVVPLDLRQMRHAGHRAVEARVVAGPVGIFVDRTEGVLGVAGQRRPEQTVAVGRIVVAPRPQRPARAGGALGLRGGVDDPFDVANRIVIILFAVAQKRLHVVGVRDAAGQKFEGTGLL